MAFAAAKNASNVSPVMFALIALGKKKSRKTDRRYKQTFLMW
jgi:hypothetical protein